MQSDGTLKLEHSSSPVHCRSSEDIRTVTNVGPLENVFQLPQIEQDGSDNGRRFRVENGDSPGEKEEVRNVQLCLLCLIIRPHLSAARSPTLITFLSDSFISRLLHPLFCTPTLDSLFLTLFTTKVEGNATFLVQTANTRLRYRDIQMYSTHRSIQPLAYLQLVITITPVLQVTSRNGVSSMLLAIMLQLLQL